MRGNAASASCLAMRSLSALRPIAPPFDQRRHRWPPYAWEIGSSKNRSSVTIRRVTAFVNCRSGPGDRTIPARGRRRLLDAACVRSHHVDTCFNVPVNCGDVTMGTFDDRLWARRLLRLSGVAAILAGLLLALATVLHSLQPRGCLGVECESRPMRTTTGTVTVLGALAALLIVLAVVGLTIIARRSGRSRGLANAGLIAAVAGFGILLVSLVVQAVFYDGDLPLMPFFVIPGILGVVIGFVLVGAFIFRSGLLPRWLGIVLAVSAVLLLGANGETTAVLLAVPFGLAVSILGFFVLGVGGRQYAAAMRNNSSPAEQEDTTPPR